MRRLDDTNYGQELRAIASANPDWRPAEIYEALRKRHGLEELAPRPDGFPSVRAVQSLIKRSRRTDVSGAWTLLEGDPEDAALVVPVLQAFDRTARSRQQRGPTKAEAEVIARIRRARPDYTVWSQIRNLATLVCAFPDQLAKAEDWLAYEPWLDNGDQLIDAAAAGAVEPAHFWPQEWAAEVERRRDSVWKDTPSGQAHLARMASRQKGTEQ
jgi:hypothetical protein